MLRVESAGDIPWQGRSSCDVRERDAAIFSAALLISDVSLAFGRQKMPDPASVCCGAFKRRRTWSGGEGPRGEVDGAPKPHSASRRAAREI